MLEALVVSGVAVPNRATWIAAVLVIGAGCTRSERADRPPLTVKIPAFGEMPAVEARLEIVPALPSQKTEALVTPLANAVYLALKACPELWSGAGRPEGMDVRYAVAGGKLSPLDAAIGKDRAGPLPPCMAKHLEGKEIPAAGSESFTVKARLLVGPGPGR